MTINKLLISTVAILLHAICSFLLINWLLRFDITGRWVSFLGFILLVLTLLYLFIRHSIAYYHFLKTKTQ